MTLTAGIASDGPDRFGDLGPGDLVERFEHVDGLGDDQVGEQQFVAQPESRSPALPVPADHR